MATNAVASARRLLVPGMLALLTLSSCSSAPSLQVADDHLIVPGERIGPFKLGMTDQELFGVGIPGGTRVVRGDTEYFFGNRSVIVGEYSRLVKTVWTYSKTDRTSSGVGVGSSLTDLYRALGPPDRTEVGTSTCGVPGRVDHVYYQNGNTVFSFTAGTCADAPTTQAQDVGIKSRESDNFD
jgi:hypothetical protein